MKTHLAKGNQHQALSLDEIFERQRARIGQKLRFRVEHYRERLNRLGIGGMSVEVHGTSGGGPSSRYAKDDSASDYRLYGGS